MSVSSAARFRKPALPFSVGSSLSHIPNKKVWEFTDQGSVLVPPTSATYVSNFCKREYDTDGCPFGFLDENGSLDDEAFFSLESDFSSQVSTWIDSYVELIKGMVSLEKEALLNAFQAIKEASSEEKQEELVVHAVTKFKNMLSDLPADIKQRYVEGLTFLLRDGPDDCAYALDQLKLPNFLNQLGVYALFFWAANTLKDADSLPGMLMALGSIAGCVRAGITFSVDSARGNMGFGDSVMGSIDVSEKGIHRAYTSASNMTEEAIIILTGIMGGSFLAGSLTATAASTVEFFEHLREHGLDSEALIKTTPILGSASLSAAQCLAVVTWVKGASGAALASGPFAPILIGVGVTLVLGYAIYETTKVWNETLDLVKDMAHHKALVDVMMTSFEHIMTDMMRITQAAHSSQKHEQLKEIIPKLEYVCSVRQYLQDIKSSQLKKEDIKLEKIHMMTSKTEYLLDNHLDLKREAQKKKDELIVKVTIFKGLLSTKKKRTFREKYCKRVKRAVRDLCYKGLAYPFFELRSLGTKMSKYRKFRSICAAVFAWPFQLVWTHIKLVGELTGIGALMDHYKSYGLTSKNTTPDISSHFKVNDKQRSFKEANRLHHMFGQPNNTKRELIQHVWGYVQQVNPSLIPHYRYEIGKKLNMASSPALQQCMRYSNAVIKSNTSEFDVEKYLQNSHSSYAKEDAVLKALYQVIFKNSIRKNLFLFSLESRLYKMNELTSSARFCA